MPRNTAKRSNGSSAAVAALCLFLVGAAWLRSQPKPRAAGTTGSGLAGEFLAHKERWGAKTGVGGDADKVDVAHPVATTVADLIALPRPDGLPTRGGPG